jgi:hypothetical protein
VARTEAEVAAGGRACSLTTIRCCATSGGFAKTYCFKRKSIAVSALGSALKDAELLGKTDHCYLTLFRVVVGANLQERLD